MTDYREALDRAVSFSGASHEFFARAKAEELLRLARGHLGDPARLEALDAGCGIGLVDRHLGGRFKSLTGTDVSAEALETAARENPSVRYELAASDRLPFADDAVDVTFAANVVQVVPNEQRAQFVSELARVTRPGGLVVVFEHNPYNPLTQIVVRRFELRDEVRMLRPNRTKRLLRENGLAEVDFGFILLFPSRRRRLLAVERGLRRLPLAAQYYVAGRPILAPPRAQPP
jgi:SAM-dependent methyltransferase